jgi:hypothetical protein
MTTHRKKCRLEKEAGANREKVEPPMKRDPSAHGEQGAYDRREIAKRRGDEKWAVHRERPVYRQGVPLANLR